MKSIYNYPGQYLLLVFVASFYLVACGKKSDGQIQKEVQAALSSPAGNRTQYPNVTAKVKDGVVQLAGRCEGEHCGDSVVARSKTVEGVKDVQSAVQQGPSQADYTLRTSVQEIVSKYEGVQADVAGGVVVLRGIIKREQVQPLMNELKVLNAKTIDNQLAIQ